MKNRLLAVVFGAMFATASHAASYEMNNNAGGKIVLTDRDCTGYEPLRKAYAYHSNGTMLDGCWAIVDKKVHIYFYTVDQRRVYNPSDFTEIKTY